MRRQDPRTQIGRREVRSIRKILTTVFNLTVWVNESVVVWEFTVRIFKTKGAGAGIDKTLWSRHAGVTSE
jgi:hypothetical protein